MFLVAIGHSAASRASEELLIICFGLFGTTWKVQAGCRADLGEKLWHLDVKELIGYRIGLSGAGRAGRREVIKERVCQDVHAGTFVRFSTYFL